MFRRLQRGRRFLPALGIVVLGAARVGATDLESSAEKRKDVSLTNYNQDCLQTNGVALCTQTNRVRLGVALHEFARMAPELLKNSCEASCLTIFPVMQEVLVADAWVRPPSSWRPLLFFVLRPAFD